MAKHVPAEVFPSDVVVATHRHASMQTVAVDVRAPGSSKPTLSSICASLMGSW
jgi:hypothetical protein